MNKIIDHVENARNNALLPALSNLHQDFVKFRLYGLHMTDKLDKRIIAMFDDMADCVESEIMRLSAANNTTLPNSEA
jgi:hypothetical protein